MRILCLCVCLVGCATDISGESVVRLESESGGMCTGFFVESNRIISSSHCYTEGVNIRIKYVNTLGKEGTVSANVIRHDEGDEGVLLLDVDVSGPVVRWCDAHTGNSVYIWGWTREMSTPSSNRGVILSHWSNKYTTIYTGTGSGYSGGPVVHDGCVIAVYHGRTQIGTGYSTKPKI